MISFRARFGGLVFLGLIAAGVAAKADVVLPPIFSGHAVLQRAAKVPVWGQASPGEKIVVTLDRATASGGAAADGNGASTWI